MSSTNRGGQREASDYYVTPQWATKEHERKIMALTRDYKQTVQAKIRRSPKFARALLEEAKTELLSDNPRVALSILRDLVHAGKGFPETARITGIGEKSLHRMLSARGNPTLRNLNKIVKCIENAR